jgi:hypothetical protein
MTKGSFNRKRAWGATMEVVLFPVTVPQSALPNSDPKVDA